MRVGVTAGASAPEVLVIGFHYSMIVHCALFVDEQQKDYLACPLIPAAAG
jgi:4-hydroxy-3-methylbut-2-enyl diphosphate reductase IspH